MARRKTFESQFAESGIRSAEAVAPALLKDLLSSSLDPNADVKREALRGRSPQTILERQIFMANLRDMLQDQNQKMTPAEQALAEKERGLKQGSLDGVRRGMVAETTPQTVVNSLTGETTTVAPRAKIITPIGGDDAVKRNEKLQALSTNIDYLQNALDALPAGRVQGFAVDNINKLTGYFPEAKTARGFNGLMIPLIAKVLAGEAGALAELEQKRAAEMLVSPMNTRQEQKIVIRDLREIIKNSAARNQQIISGGMFRGAQPAGGPGAALQQTAQPTSADRVNRAAADLGFGD